VPSIVERLNVYELQFLTLIERFQRVWAYEVELTKATRAKRFRPRNLAIWDVMLADRDMFAIDSASWVTSFVERFLDKLSMDDHTDFGVGNAPAEDADDRHFATMQFEARGKAFARLFPVRTRERKSWPEKADIKRLRAELVILASGLEKQRDARAHLYDGKDADTIQNLHFEHVANIFRHVRQILHDVRLLADHSGFHFPDVKEPDADQTARHLVDLLLLGSIQLAVSEWHATPSVDGERERQFLWQHRAAYYEHLHARHDGRAAADERLFNDPDDD